MTSRLPRLLGILNCTPDSFSDGGRHDDLDLAVAAGRQMWALGAWAIDVGGESTRPGATPVPAEVEMLRVLPVIKELVAAGIRVSIDTMKSRVALACVEAGAEIVNDVTGGLHDAEMLGVLAETDATVVLGHWRRHGSTMARHSSYHDVVGEVRDELAARAEAAHRAGIPRSRLVLDPGIGFAKSSNDSWAVIRGLDQITGLGVPVMLGLSRKSFLSAIDGLINDEPHERDDLTATTTALAVLAGVHYVRVHDIRANRRAASVAMHWSKAENKPRHT